MLLFTYFMTSFLPHQKYKMGFSFPYNIDNSLCGYLDVNQRTNGPVNTHLIAGPRVSI